MAAHPIRGVRVPEPVWTDAKAIAAARGETVSDVVNASLVRYVNRHKALLAPKTDTPRSTR